MSSEHVQAVVAAAAREVRARYVFADKAERIADSLEERLSAGEYDDVPYAAALADRITADLLAAEPDRHLRVRWHDEARDSSPVSQWDDPDFLAAYWREQDLFNQGITAAQRLPGNVGFLTVESIDEPEGTGEVIESAIAFLRRVSALLVDVRKSTGGAPSGVAFFVSHFVSPPAKHLIDGWNRAGAVVEQTWTTPYVRTRLADIPLFVLTSERTPSGCEELAYDLQALGRAVVVGEKTVGAANPVDVFRVDPHLSLQVPTARVASPLTSGNWEGTGVVPDVACPAQDAVQTAHRLAVRAVLDRHTTDGPALPSSLREEARNVLAG